MGGGVDGPVGVSQAAGSRWFRERGGILLFMFNPVTGRYLSFAEREQIATLKATDLARWTRDGLAAVVAALNNRPYRTLDWKAPVDALNELLSLQQSRCCDDRLNSSCARWSVWSPT